MHKSSFCESWNTLNSSYTSHGKSVDSSTKKSWFDPRELKQILCPNREGVYYSEETKV